MLEFGDVVRVEGEEEDFLLVSVTGTRASIMRKVDNDRENDFTYSIMTVDLDKVEPA